MTDAAVGDSLPVREEEATLSKNQQKKLKRKQLWEEGRENRKKIRREKTKQKKARKREANQAPAESENGFKKHVRPVQVPITFVLDCQFDDLMTDSERMSLGSQLTRCYSDNRKAPFKAHLAVSSFGGKLRERFEGILARTHEGWQGVRFLDEDFEAVANMASTWMRDDKTGGKIAGAFQVSQESSNIGEVVYLTSDSPDTLDRLCPYSTYIIGGLVDKNRHKGTCYKRAMDRGMRTAKLPIGEFMQMQSRFVLTTNHVVEIMLKWLELGDWGEAFLKVIPKRKGGILKTEHVKEDHVEDEDSSLSSADAAKDQVRDDGDDASEAIVYEL